MADGAGDVAEGVTPGWSVWLGVCVRLGLGVKDGVREGVADGVWVAVGV